MTKSNYFVNPTTTINPRTIINIVTVVDNDTTGYHLLKERDLVCGEIPSGRKSIEFLRAKHVLDNSQHILIGDEMDGYIPVTPEEFTILEYIPAIEDYVTMEVMGKSSSLDGDVEVEFGDPFGPTTVEVMSRKKANRMVREYDEFAENQMANDPFWLSGWVYILGGV